MLLISVILYTLEYSSKTQGEGSLLSDCPTADGRKRKLPETRCTNFKYLLYSVAQRRTRYLGRADARSE